MSPRETARIIDDVATQIEGGQRGFEIQAALVKGAEGLIPLKHAVGIALLNRIAMQVLNIETKDGRYAIVAQTMKELGPFEPESAVSSLRELADEVSRLTLPPK
jgi:hypothetical protein